MIIGCGDVGQRIAALACKHWRVFGIARSRATTERIRAAGAVPLIADASRPSRGARRRRLQDLADWVVHCAPPPESVLRPDGRLLDPLTRAWTAKLLRPVRRVLTGDQGGHAGLPRLAPSHRKAAAMAAMRPARAAKRLVYLSTTGVYGDREGQLISEASGTQPITDRAKRRVDAEEWLMGIGRRSTGLRVTVLRVPGIYAIDRLPLKRIQDRLPALLPQDDVQTNHIHAQDLARMARTALLRHRIQRILNIVDDSRLPMGDYLDLVARWAGLPPPPRIDRRTLLTTVSPMRASFMSESRQLANQRMKRELRLALRYPTVADFLAAHKPPD